MRRWGLSAIPLLAAILLSAAASNSVAADVDGYVAVRSGIYSPQEGPLKEFDDGFSGEVFVGSYLRRHCAVELGVGYFETDGPGTIVAPGPVVVPAKATLWVIPVTVNVRALYPVGEVFEPFAEGGVGVYVADAKLSGGGFELSDRYTNIGVHLGLGAYVNFTKTLFLGLQGRYLWVEKHKFMLGQASQNLEIDGYMATVGLGYRFAVDLEKE